MGVGSGTGDVGGPRAQTAWPHGAYASSRVELPATDHRVKDLGYMCQRDLWQLL